MFSFDNEVKKKPILAGKWSKYGNWFNQLIFSNNSGLVGYETQLDMKKAHTKLHPYSSVWFTLFLFFVRVSLRIPIAITVFVWFNNRHFCFNAPLFTINTKTFNDCLLIFFCAVLGFVLDRATTSFCFKTKDSAPLKKVKQCISLSKSKSGQKYFIHSFWKTLSFDNFFVQRKILIKSILFNKLLVHEDKIDNNIIF